LRYSALLKKEKFAMPIVTIIGCRIFEDGVMHLIEKESEKDDLIGL
jgi:hypothetical protein